MDVVCARGRRRGRPGTVVKPASRGGGCHMLLTLVCPCLAALLAVGGAEPPPPSRACEARMDAWCNVKTNNPSCTQSCGKGEKMYALRQNGSQAFQPQPGPAWRCYAASTLDKTHTIYDGTSRCYSSEQVQLEWQLCACNAGCPSSATVCAKCGAMPKPRGFHPSPPPPSPPSPPAPPGPTVVNIPLFQPGEANRTGFRIPALLAVGPRTLYAFAESRTGNGDGCFARHPVVGDNRTAIVFKTSTDGGTVWSDMTDLCPDGTGNNGCLDYEAVFDEVAQKLIVQYCLGKSESNCTNMQRSSTDQGKSWSVPLALKATLGADDGVLVGPGRGLQLQSDAHGKAGRLLFCGHKQDPYSGRVSPIWVSDDHGESYAVKASLPRGTPAPLDRHGPDECQFAELANGTIVYNARNNWPTLTKPYRFKTTSTDGGDSWAPVSFDTGLEGNSCQGSLISTANLSNTLYFSHPMGAARTRMTVRRSGSAGAAWEKELEIYAGGAAYSCLSPMPSAFGSDEIALLFERSDDAQCTQGSSCLIAFARFPADW